jgi:hypothetical protein
MCCGVDERYPATLQFFGDRCKHRLIAAVVSQTTIPQSDRSEIWNVPDETKWIMDACLGNAANHDGFIHVPLAEFANPTARAIQRHFGPLGAEVAEFIVGMATKGNARDVQASCPHS